MDLTRVDEATALESVLIQGDLSKLSTEQRVVYYNRVCNSLGLNALTRPFEYLTLNGKLTLYARRDATDQLRANQKVSVTIVSREKIGDVYVVTSRATQTDGRQDESTGAVCVANLRGEALANALMKAETKSKRRVTLSICGLGCLDETEVEDIPLEAKVPVTPMIQAPKSPASYVVPFGRYQGKQLSDVPINDLADYVLWIEDDAQKNRKTLMGRQAEFVVAAKEYLEHYEEPQPPTAA